jgi:hypothetical protein
MNRKQAAELLNCSPHDTPDIINSAYRKKMRTVHVDRTKLDDSFTKDVNLARETLIRHSSLSNIDAKPRSAVIFVEKGDMNGLYPIEGWCMKCNNHSGFVFPVDGSLCSVCKGRGCTGDRISGDLHCSVCLGSGFLLSNDHRCTNCIGGSKKVLIHVKFSIDENAKKNDIVHEMAYPEHGYEKITFILK